MDQGTAYRRVRHVGLPRCRNPPASLRPTTDQDRSLPTTAVLAADSDTRILLGQEPIPLPQPFADMLHQHVATRPNLRTAGGLAPARGYSPACDLGVTSRQTIMKRLRSLGIN